MDEEASAMFKETLAKEQTDWGADNVEANAFETTPDVEAALVEPVSDSTVHAVVVEAERLEARREALP